MVDCGEGSGVLSVHVGLWDVVMVVAVTVLGTFIAYLRSPILKAFVLSLPIPFTTACLALGKPVGVSNSFGLLALLGFIHLVRILYVRLKVPISASIAISTALYGLLGAFFSRTLPNTELFFGECEIAVLIIAVILYFGTPRREEPSHRSPMPVWQKAVVIAGVVSGLVIVKGELGGFVTTFPMVTIITAYEARHSLWTICRQMPIILMGMSIMIAITHSFQPTLGLPLSLFISWVAMMAILLPLTMYHRRM